MIKIIREDLKLMLFCIENSVFMRELYKQFKNYIIRLNNSNGKFELSEY